MYPIPVPVPVPVPVPAEAAVEVESGSDEGKGRYGGRCLRPMGPGPAGTGEPHAAQGTGDRPDVLSLPRPDEDRPDAAAVRHHDVCVQRERWRGRERDLERVIVLYDVFQRIENAFYKYTS